MSFFKNIFFKALTSLIIELETEPCDVPKNFAKSLLMINAYDAKSYITQFRRRSFLNYILASYMQLYFLEKSVVICFPVISISQLLHLRTWMFPFRTPYHRCTSYLSY